MLSVILPLEGATWGELRKLVEIGSGIPDDQEVEIDYDGNGEVTGLIVDLSREGGHQ